MEQDHARRETTRLVEARAARVQSDHRSSSPVAANGRRYSQADCWITFARERRGDSRYLERARDENVVLLSGIAISLRLPSRRPGDRGHLGSVRQSRIQRSPSRRRKCSTHDSGKLYCVFDIDTAHEPPQLTLEIYEAGLVSSKSGVHLGRSDRRVKVHAIGEGETKPASLVRLILCRAPLALPRGRAEEPNIVFIFADDLGVNDLAATGAAITHATSRSPRERKGALHHRVLRAADLLAVARRADDRQNARPAASHDLSAGPCGRAFADAASSEDRTATSARRKNARRVAQGGGIRHGVHRQMASWRRGIWPREQGFDVVFRRQGEHHAVARRKVAKASTISRRRRSSSSRRIKARPFFLYLAHNNPHIPLAAQPELIAKHEGAFNPVYAAMIETLDECCRPPARQARRAQARGEHDRGLHVRQWRTACARVARTRQRRTTAVPRGQRLPLRRRSAHSADRALAGPSHCREVSSSTPVISTDWVPTLLEVAGVRSPAARLDGISLVPLLSAGADASRPRALLALPALHQPGRAPWRRVREGRLEADRALRGWPRRAVQSRAGRR